MLRPASIVVAFAASAILAPTPRAAAGPDDLLQRLVRAFDFEDAAARPMEMPRHVRRFGGPDDPSGAAASGFPLFGEMRLSDDRAAEGRWSLRFTLDGGSMAAQVPSGVVPVMPDSDHHLAVRVRTEDLVHARVRLAAWLYDRDGRPIPGSRRESPAVTSPGTWTTLEVDLPGRSPDAVDLGIELALLQPAQLGAVDDGAPRRQDVRGRAWFDDLRVWYVPQVELRTSAPSNVLPAEAPGELHASVHDLVDDDLVAGLDVLDLDDRVVRAAARPTASRHHELAVDLGGLPRGWYRGRLRLVQAGREIARQDHDFVVGTSPVTASSLGVVVDRFDAETVDMIERLGAGTVLLPVPAAPERADARALERLLEAGRTIVFRVERTAAELAAAFDVADGGTLAPQAEFLLRYGPRVTRWEVPPSDEASDRAALASIRRLLPALELVTAWSAERDAPTDRPLHRTLPWELPPEALPALAASWSNPPALVTLRGAPASLYHPRERLIDLLRRALEAWRAGVGPILIEAPWHRTVDGAIEPEPAFAAWAGLAGGLDGRRFAGTLAADDADIALWLAAGDDRPAALVAWAPRPVGAAPVTMAVDLGPDPITTVDAFGNRARLPRDDVDGHRLVVGATPRFHEGIDLELARFRADLAFEPAFVPTAMRLLEGRLHLRNPWTVPITGTVRLDDTDAWRITPRAQSFTISPGAELALPLTIVPGRTLAAGRRLLGARFELTADRTYRFLARTPFEVGLADLHVEPTWRLEPDGRTLAIEITVTNEGDVPRSLTAFLHGPGIASHQRPIGRLAPGETTRRIFHVPDGAAAVGGRTLLVGVDDRDRAARLTVEMNVPVLPVAPTVASETSTH